MDYIKLKNTVETSKVSISELCKKIGIDRKTFYNNIENKNLKVETLEKICAILDISINIFLPAKPKNYASEEKISYASESEVAYGTIDYKTKYFETLEKLNAANERLLAYTDIKKDLTKKKKTV